VPHYRTSAQRFVGPAYCGAETYISVLTESKQLSDSGGVRFDSLHWAKYTDLEIQ
jgi:hypothetical protein